MYNAHYVFVQKSDAKKKCPLSSLVMLHTSVNLDIHSAGNPCSLRKSLVTGPEVSSVVLDKQEYSEEYKQSSEKLVR
jgi:hypothetical protein